MSDSSMTEKQRQHVQDEIRAELYPKRSPRRDEKGRAVWPRIPSRPCDAREKARSRPSGRVAPNKGDKRSDLEVLSRLGGSTTYRTPEAGRSTKHSGISTDDICGAVGFVKDPLDQRLALALACHTVSEWPAIEDLAHAPLLGQLLGSHNTRKLVSGKWQIRVRLILREVFHDLALVRIPIATKEAAEVLKMTQRDYRELYRSTAGFIETRGNAGAHVAITKLYGDGWEQVLTS